MPSILINCLSCFTTHMIRYPVTVTGVTTTHKELVLRIMLKCFLLLSSSVLESKSNMSLFA
jgi:hypothetical protein